MKKLTILLRLVTFCLALILSTSVLAQPIEKTASEVISTSPKIKSIATNISQAGSFKVIFIGNSFFYYNNSLHGHVSRFVSEGIPQIKYRSSSVTISGSGLSWHDVDSYFRPNGIGTYSFLPGNKVAFNDPGQKLFDVAIMMDCSQCPIHPKLKDVFKEYVKKHSDTVRRHGAKPVLFMSWAYADAPEMTAQLAAAYTQAGNDNDGLVIPAGLAFARSREQLPDVNLYVPDKRHPSLAGTYLAAATVYATLFAQSPAELIYNPGLDEAVARRLREIAWESVQEYFQQP